MVETGIICWLATGLLTQVNEDSNSVLNFGMFYGTVLFLRRILKDAQIKCIKYSFKFYTYDKTI